MAHGEWKSTKAFYINPSELVGKYTKDGGKIIGYEYSSGLLVAIVRIQNRICVYDVLTLSIHDTDPTATEKR